MSVPSIRNQFRSEVAVQGKRMVDVMVSLLLRMAVAARTGPGSEEYKQLRLQCRQFVKRHREYGVLINQYNIVGEALLHSLHTCIGDEGFNAATRTAWIRLYSFVVQQVAVFDEELRAEGPQPKEGSKKNSKSGLEAAGAGAGAGSKSTSRTVTPKHTPATIAATPPTPSKSMASGCPMQHLTQAFALPPAHSGLSVCPHNKQTAPSPHK